MEENRISAYELRLGNIILIDGKPRKVEGITKRKISFHYAKGEHNIHYRRLCECHGAPLELLGEDFVKAIKTEFPKKCFKYIHEFQNYYHAITGRDAIITVINIYDSI